MRRCYKKLLALVLSAVLLFSMVPVAYAQQDNSYHDIQGHWAQSSIERWSEYGVVQGYEGAFDPDGSLTRGQMATILSRALGLSDVGENPFSDVKKSDWFADAILCCYEAGILEGDGTGNAKPNDPVSREEAMVMLCRALGIKPAQEGDLSAFADQGDVSSWAAPYLTALVQEGLISGVGNGRLAPIDMMSRAAVMKVLDSAVVQYISEPGTYELTDAKGIILVACGDVTLTGKTSAQVLVTPAADDASLTFDGAEITGELVVQADRCVITSNDSELPEISWSGTDSKLEEGDTSADDSGDGADGSGSSSGTGSSGSTGSSSVRPHRHKWDDGVVTVSPTLTQAGVMTFTCSGCQTTKTEVIPATGTQEQLQLLDAAQAAGLLRYLQPEELGDITRLEIAKLMAALCELPVSSMSAGQLSFADCAQLTDQERGIVAAVCRAEIMAPTGQDSFSPRNVCTRAQIAEILFRSLDIPAMGSGSVTDMNSNHWAWDAVNTLLYLEIVEREPNGVFEPNTAADKQTVLTWLLAAADWLDSRTPVGTVTGFSFAQDRSSAIRVVLELPQDSDRIDRYRVDFWSETDQEWRSGGSCGDSMPVTADLPSGRYTRLRVTSVAKDPVACCDAGVILNCDLAIENTRENSAEQVSFVELGTDADGVMGYQVSVYRIGPDTEHVLLNLAQEGNGSGRRMEIAGNGFNQDHTRATFEIYHDMLADYIPGGYYRVVEMLGSSVDANDPAKAQLRVMTRGGWEPIELSSAQGSSYAVSNIRFEGPYLRWDPPANISGKNVHYRIWLPDGQGGWFTPAGTGQNKVATYMMPEGSYDEVRIETFVDDVSRTRVTAALKLSVSEDPEMSAPSRVVFTPIGNGRYQADVYSLSPDTSCILHLVNAPDHWNKGEFQDARADANGVAHFVFGGSQTMDLLQNGYYVVLEQTYNHISGNGTICDTRFAYRGYPVKCNVSMP